MIRIQRIYKFLLFHSIILSILNILYAFLCYFISFLGTNLLTQCLVPVAVFCLFLDFQIISTKRSPNATKLFDDYFLDIRDPRSFGRRPDDGQGDGKATGRALGGGARLPCGPHVASSDLIPLL